MSGLDRQEHPSSLGRPGRRDVLRAAGVAGTAGAVAAVAAGCGFIAAGKKQAEVPQGPLDLGPAADVPVGGGRVYPVERVVVTQPSAGTYEAFSAVCTHQGCLVSSVADGAIHCACHGSAFSASDGVVLAGPATEALPRAQVKVTEGGDLIVG